MIRLIISLLWPAGKSVIASFLQHMRRRVSYPAHVLPPTPPAGQRGKKLEKAPEKQADNFGGNSVTIENMMLMSHLSF